MRPLQAAFTPRGNDEERGVYLYIYIIDIDILPIKYNHVTDQTGLDQIIRKFISRTGLIITADSNIMDPVHYFGEAPIYS